MTLLGALACSSRDATPEAPADARADAAPDGAAPAGEIIAGSNDDLPLLTLGGTRLKVRRLEGDGAAVSGGWFDMQLDGQCALLTGPDGQLRCFPSDSVVASDVRYLDDACTKPVAVLARTACAAPAYLTRPDDSPVCPPGRVLFRRGPEVPAGTTLFAKNAGGCSAALAATAAQVAYELGASVPLESLVLARLRMGASSGRLAPFYYETDDGARLVPYLYDTELKMDCALARAMDGKIRCLPRTQIAVSSSTFSDSTCNTAAATTPGPGCPGVTALVRSIPNACPVTSAAYRVGAKLETSYAKAGEECKASTATAYPLGEELAPFMFVEGTPTVHPGPGRLRMRLNSSALGAQRTGVVKDQTLGLDCASGVAGDGKTRCLPLDTADIVAPALYGDAACTVRLARRNAAACSPTHAALVDSTTVCPPRRLIFELGSRHAGQLFQHGGDGACAPAVALPDADHYVVGAEVSPARFVELGVVLH
jgi:hypothetical protein